MPDLSKFPDWILNGRDVIMLVAIFVPLTLLIVLFKILANAMTGIPNACCRNY